jgi:hypothetical protein
MDASWVAAIASVASAFVVGIAAIAALVQIRHVRNANEIAIYLRLVDRLDSTRTATSFEAMETFAKEFKTDASLRLRLRQARPVPEFSELESLIRFFDNLTMLIVAGSENERLILPKYADDIVRVWDTVAEAVYLRRDGVGPYFALMFEHLAMRAKAYLKAGKADRFYGRLRRDPRMVGREFLDNS